MDIHAEDASGNPIYDDRIEELIFDTYLHDGVRPGIQLDSMPQVMSTNSNPYVHQWRRGMHQWRRGMHQWRRGMPYAEVFTDLAYPPKVDGPMHDVQRAVVADRELQPERGIVEF